MTICSSCEGEVETATGQCLRCGYGQPGSGLTADDSPGSVPEYRTQALQTVNEGIFPVVGPAAAGPDVEVLAVEVPDAEAAGLVVEVAPGFAAAAEMAAQAC